MSWCATDTAWEYPEDIQHRAYPPPQARHWTKLSAQRYTCHSSLLLIFFKKTKSIIFRCWNVLFTICPLNKFLLFIFCFFPKLLMHYIWLWPVALTLDLMVRKEKKSLVLPFRSCKRVLDTWLSLHTWFTGESEIFSSQQMKDGHAAKPWSKEFRKQVFPKFNRPGTIPRKEK